MNLPRRRLVRISALGSLALAASALYVLLTPPEPDPLEQVLLTDPDFPTPMPAITVNTPTGEPAFSTTEIAQGGRPVLLNIFASWCAPCVMEAPVLNDLRRQGVTLWGIAFRDRPEATAAFLERHGNPFERIGFDLTGQATGPLGLTGVPESLLVDGGGTIRSRWPSGITDDIARDTLLPRWRRLS